MLDEAVFFDTLRQGLWVAVAMSAPILAVALVTGLAIGLFQALTSIQEMTLTFVPKLLAIVAVFLGVDGVHGRNAGRILSNKTGPHDRRRLTHGQYRLHHTDPPIGLDA